MYLYFAIIHLEGEIVLMIKDAEKSRELMSKELWLSFFNEYLYKNGFISQEERLKMNTKIRKTLNISGICRLRAEQPSVQPSGGLPARVVNGYISHRFTV